MKGGEYKMSEKIHTREFCISDYDAALQLWHRVEGLEIAEGDEREGIAQFLARNQGLSWVAVDGSAIVGAALCGNDGRRGHIYHLAVDPAYQRCGLGKRLLDEYPRRHTFAACESRFLWRPLPVVFRQLRVQPASPALITR